MEPGKMSEAITEGSKALTKFGEIVDKMFTPRWTRKKADADAYADERRLQVIRNNPDMEIIYTNGSMNARARNPEAVLARADQRLLAEAVRQEDNLEQVLSITEQEVMNENCLSNEDVDDDWLARFFDIAKDISAEELQLIWGKILAGEIKKPGSFSLRTLDVLRNISTAEAKAFQKILPLLLNSSGEKILIHDKDLLSKYDVTFGDILILDDCGLVNANGASMTFTVSQEKSVMQYSSNRVILHSTTAGVTSLSFGIYRLNKTACEISEILACPPNDQFILDTAQKIFESNKGKNLQLAVHEISIINGANIGFYPWPLLELK